MSVCLIIISDNVEFNINPLNFIDGDKWKFPNWALQWICDYLWSCLDLNEKKKQEEDGEKVLHFLCLHTDSWWIELSYDLMPIEWLYVYRNDIDSRHVYAQPFPVIVCESQTNALWKSMNWWDSSIDWSTHTHTQIEREREKKTFE